MGDGLLQRFSTSTSTSMPALVDAGSGGITQRVHHHRHDPSPPALIGGKYPVYGPGTGPDIYDDELPEYWPGGDPSGPGGFFPSFLPWGQPAPAPPPPPPPPPYPVHRGPYGGKGLAKGPRFRGASMAVLTLLAFLFFLSILQNYIRDYSGASHPTVILLSAGATKENLPLYPYRVRQKVGQRSDEDPVRFEDEDDADGASAFGPHDQDGPQAGSTPDAGIYRARVKKGPAPHKRHQKKGTPGGHASSGTPPVAPFGDIFKVNGL